MKTTLLVALLSSSLIACAHEDEDVGESALPITAAPFVVAEQGCSMAHCDAQMSDGVGLSAPRGPVATRWQDFGGWGRLEPAGSSIGLGCSSNGRVAACTYGGFNDNLVVYRADGSIVYRKQELGAFAWTSGPMIDEAGGVITADSRYLYRYGPTGARYWRTPTPGGFPISPVMTDDGVVVLATKGGPLSTFRTTDGRALDQLDLGFDTENTPGVSGNRIYVSTAQGSSDAKLAAVDVSQQGVLTDAWGQGAYHYQPSSGASPTVHGDRVFFDGHLNGKPYVFCVRDDGDHATEMWRHEMKSDVTASLARDPRGGVWTYGVGTPELIRLRESDGAILDTIDTDALAGGLAVYSPSSVLSMTGDADQPVMLLSLRANGTLKTYLAAIDLASGSLLWKEQLWPWTDSTAAQFPIVLDDQNEPVVVFPTYAGGARGVRAR